MPADHGYQPHGSHWGSFLAADDGGTLLVKPYPGDVEPSPILGNIPDAPGHPTRVDRPMVRKGWLRERGRSGAARGQEPFVSVDWDVALDLVAGELRRIIDQAGPAAVYGGSYGWASAGRFHHAQSQVHRFLNCLGGYTRSVNTYSAGAAEVILPHVLAAEKTVCKDWVMWPDIVASTRLVVAFGGMAVKNSAVGSGGISSHVARSEMARAHANGCEFVLISPLRDDLPPDVAATWVPIRVGTDVALMLGLAYHIVSRDAHDAAFVERCTVGFDRFRDYLTGVSDGVPKTPRWAAAITGIDEDRIVDLADRMASRRTLVTVSHSLQRAEHGEQPVWMGVVLAAILGQIGLPGGGFAYALGLGNNGRLPAEVGIPTLPQGHNRVDSYIPVARIADMLLHPGEPFSYNGHDLRYPKVSLVYWAGGNPFHHHQDLNRLRRAFALPETIVVHEPFWTATARHADIVLPSTISLERDDLGAGRNDHRIIAMHQVVPKHAEAWNDYDIFTELAARLDVHAEFTAGRSAREWLEHLYDGVREQLGGTGRPAPTFDEFWAAGYLELPLQQPRPPLQRFRADPARHPLDTPSGRIEICSATIESFGYDDCPGHPTWLEPTEVPDERFPLCLVANQPSTRLHSQLDFGSTSRASKVAGREPVRIHPVDAQARGVRDGDVVRIFTDRGACLAGAVVNSDVSPGVVQMSTGAWYDPVDPHDEHTMCAHGNPNVVTRDAGTSRLAQGCTGQVTRVQLERFTGTVPPVRCHEPPAIEPMGAGEVRSGAGGSATSP